MPPLFMLSLDMLPLDIESPFCIEPCCIEPCCIDDDGGDMELDAADWAKTTPVASRQLIAMEAPISLMARIFLPSMIERHRKTRRHMGATTWDACSGTAATVHW